MTALKCRPILAWTHDDVYLRNESWDSSVVIGRWPGVNPGQPVHFGLFFDFFADISVPNKSKTTKQRRPDSLRNASWHKSEPAIWVVNIFVNIENKPTYLRSGSILYIEEWHSYWHVGTGYMASKIRTCARSMSTMSMVVTLCVVSMPEFMSAIDTKGDCVCVNYD